MLVEDGALKSDSRRNGVAPMLIAANVLGGVILIEQVPRSVAVHQAVWIVHEVDRWREVELWPERLRVRRNYDRSEDGG